MQGWVLSLSHEGGPWAGFRGGGEKVVGRDGFELEAGGGNRQTLSLAGVTASAA